MNEISWQTPFGYVIFSDDIRYELDNKITFIGTYSVDLIVNAPFPVLLPKLGLSVRYYERQGESDEPVSLEIYLPGDGNDNPSYRADLDYQQMRSMPLAPNTEGVDMRVGAVMNVILSPAQLVKEGYIKVRARRGENLYKLGALKVINRFVPPDAAPPEGSSVDKPIINNDVPPH